MAQKLIAARQVHFHLVLRTPFLFTLPLVLSIPGCSREAPLARLRQSPPQNLLLVTIDTLRADRVGCYGYAGAHTPHLDQLAAEGVRFQYAIAPVPLTLPSHASLLTGHYPASHGVHVNGRQQLPEDIPTLPELLGERIPYRGAVVASASLDSVFGLGRGFVDYDDRIPPAPQNRFLLQSERRAEEVARLATQWLAQAGKPFFLWVHWFDPHTPYEAPLSWSQKLDDPYDAEVAYTDDVLGRFLEGLGSTGSLERTLVVVAGDHGESLGDHGELTHGIFLYDATVHVPLVFYYPAGLTGGRVIPGQVRVIDVMPTVLDMMGVEPPEGMQGVSLLPMLLGEQEDLGLEAYLETQMPSLLYGWSPLRGLRGSDWKYVAAPQEELYNLSTDPDELVNLAASQPQRSAGLRSRLQEASTRVGFSPSTAVHYLDPELRRQLESLGYIGGRDTDAGEISGPDPKRMAHLLPIIARAVKASEAGRFDAATTDFRAILEENPGNLYARRLLARSLMRMGQTRASEREYRQLLEDAPQDAAAMNVLGTLAMRAGRFEEAERLLTAAKEANPWDPRIRNSLAFLLARRGDVEGAERLMIELLAEDPDFVKAALNLATLRHQTGRSGEAEKTLRDLLSRVPENIPALRALAAILREQGRDEEARRLLEEFSQ